MALELMSPYAFREPMGGTSKAWIVGEEAKATIKACSIALGLNVPEILKPEDEEVEKIVICPLRQAILTHASIRAPDPVPARRSRRRHAD